jgi:alkaline phosphatase D
MDAADVPVRVRVWTDQGQRKLLREWDVRAVAEDAHSVHAKVDGLQPGREYWYQFSVADFESPIGRTRTSSRTAPTTTLAVASCQSWQSGHYAAFADMAAWAPDCVVHVGDYIYEGGMSPLGERVVERDGGKLAFRTIRQHNGPEIVSLWDYRNRYALYNSDPSLQAARAASPWIVAMDDHEIDNNWASDTPQDPWAQTPLEWKVRKIAALKAYYEHMPIEKPAAIDGLESSLQMFGVYRFGPAQVHLLDTRQYRSDQVCGEGFPGQTPCPDAERADRTMMGEAQERWLSEALRRSDAAFNVLASQTWLSSYRYNKAPAPAAVNFDSWDGYTPARRRLLDVLGGVSNPVVISGDWHCAAAATLHADPFDAKSKRIGHEFAGTSISSDCPWIGAMEKSRIDNPHVRHLNGRQRGYCRFEVDAKSWTTDFRVVDDPYDPRSRLRSDLQVRTGDL